MYKLLKIIVVELMLLIVILVSNYLVNYVFKVVRVFDKSNLSVFEMGISSFGGMGWMYFLGIMKDNVNSLWFLEEDRWCKYFENFNLFF